jgi:Spy/CpxP family protein refolding chaperone
MKNLSKTVVFSALMVLIFTASYAGGPDKSGNMPMAPSGPPSILTFAVDLDLTAEQISKLMDVEKASKKSMEKIMKEFKKLMSQMQNEMDRDNPDRTKIDAIIDSISANHGSMMRARTYDMLAIKSILTKEQNKKMKTLFGRMMHEKHNGPPSMEMDGRH